MGNNILQLAEAKNARSMVEAAYAMLRDDILNGVLEPGERLRVEVLKDRYEVGASTLREALRRLVGEALVTSEEQRGFRVAEISLQDFADLTKTRILIEGEALFQSIQNGDDEWEANLVATFHRLSKVEQSREAENAIMHTNEFEIRNREFHRALISACPSPWLMKFQRILFGQSERYRRISLNNKRIPRDVHSEHKAIVEAALARDAQKARKLEEQHIEKTLEVLSHIVATKAEEID